MNSKYKETSEAGLALRRALLISVFNFPMTATRISVLVALMMIQTVLSW